MKFKSAEITRKCREYVFHHTCVSVCVHFCPEESECMRVCVVKNLPKLLMRILIQRERRRQ